MAKTLNVPDGITADEIIDNSDIGDLSDNDDGTIDATNVDTTDVRNVLGEDTNNVGKLCTSDKVNRWSLFKPGRNKVDSDNEEIIYDQSTPYRLGDFLGYDHSAETDYVNHSNDTTYHYSNDGIVITCNWEQHQMNWYQEMKDDDEVVTDLIFLVKDSDGNVQFKDVAPLEDKAGRVTYHMEVSSVPEGTWTCELWFGDSWGSGLSEHSLVAHVPDNEWQFEIVSSECSEPTCNVTFEPQSNYDSSQDDPLDPDADGTREIDFVVESKSVDDSDNSWSISFHFENDNPDIGDGRIYGTKDAGSTWHLLKNGSLLWWNKDQTYTESGIFPDIVLNYSNSSGSFDEDEKVVGQTSGAEGYVAYDSGSALNLRDVSGTFDTGEEIKGQSSNETADIDSIEDVGGIECGETIELRLTTLTHYE